MAVSRLRQRQFKEFEVGSARSSMEMNSTSKTIAIRPALLAVSLQSSQCPDLERQACDCDLSAPAAA